MKNRVYPPWPDGKENDERYQLFAFLVYLKIHGVIKGVSTAFGGSLQRKVAQQKVAEAGTKSDVRPFRLGNMPLTSFGKFKAGSDLCMRIIDVLPNCDVPDEQLELVRDAYQHYFNRPYDGAPGADFHLFRRDGIQVPTGPNGEICYHGDYVMYRVEQRRAARQTGGMETRISRNFLRFSNIRITEHAL